MSVIVGGAIFFAAGLVCLALAVWISRTRKHPTAPRSRRVRNNPAPRRVMTRADGAPLTTARAYAGPAPAPVPLQASESYYAQAPPSRAKGRPMGWYSVDGSLADERFWDGSTWTARRQLVEGAWAPVPLAG